METSPSVSFSRQRQSPDTGDDLSLAASGLRSPSRFSERKEEIGLTLPGFIKQDMTDDVATASVQVPFN